MGAAARLVSLAWGLAMLLGSGAVAASPQYTDALKSALELPCAPACTLCHSSPEGGFGTIRPGSFGASMMQQGGLTAGSEERLRCAVALLDPECVAPLDCDPSRACVPVDTDADGATDVDELRAGEDPNVAGGQPLCGVRYGCGASIAPAGSQGGATPLGVPAALAGLVGLGLWLHRPRGRRIRSR